MNSTSFLPALIPVILPRLPFLLVCVAGIVIGLVQLRSHRKPAVLVLVASTLLGLNFAISIGLNLLSLQRVQSGESHVELATIFGVLGIVQGLLSAAAYSTLIGAAFSGRNPPPVGSGVSANQ